MTDIRIPNEAVAAVKAFIASRGLRVRWWKANADSLESVEGSERGISLVDAFLTGWICGRGEGSGDGEPSLASKVCA